MPSCQRFEVNDAQAYLLERLGDIAAAIKLYVKDIQGCNAALIHAVLQGELQLPNITGRCCAYLSSQMWFRLPFWVWQQLKSACFRSICVYMFCCSSLKVGSSVKLSTDVSN